MHAEPRPPARAGAPHLLLERCVIHPPFRRLRATVAALARRGPARAAAAARLAAALLYRAHLRRNARSLTNATPTHGDAHGSARSHFTKALAVALRKWARTAAVRVARRAVRRETVPCIVAAGACAARAACQSTK